MSRSINKVILIGHIGSDIEQRHMANGNMAVNFSMATNKSWLDKNSGERVQKTEWHRIAGFNKPAEIIAQYAAKGQLVYIEGELQTRKWQDQSGNDRYTTEILVSVFRILSEIETGGAQRPVQKPAQRPATVAG